MTESQQAFGDVGAIYFVTLYLLAIVASDVPTYFKQKDNPGYNSLGASGGVAGVLFAFILFLDQAGNRAAWPIRAPT